MAGFSLRPNTERALTLSGNASSDDQRDKDCNTLMMARRMKEIPLTMMRLPTEMTIIV